MFHVFQITQPIHPQKNLNWTTVNDIAFSRANLSSRLQQRCSETPSQHPRDQPKTRQKPGAMGLESTSTEEPEELVTDDEYSNCQKDEDRCYFKSSVIFLLTNKNGLVKSIVIL